MRDVTRPRGWVNVGVVGRGAGGEAAALFAGAGDGGDEVAGSKARGFAVERAVQEEDLDAGTAGDGVADTAQDEGGRDGGVQAADAVDDGFGGVDGREHGWVGDGEHFLPVRVDVPDA